MKLGLSYGDGKFEKPTNLILKRNVMTKQESGWKRIELTLEITLEFI